MLYTAPLQVYRAPLLSELTWVSKPEAQVRRVPTYIISSGRQRRIFTSPRATSTRNSATALRAFNQHITEEASRECFKLKRDIFTKVETANYTALRQVYSSLYPDFRPTHDRSTAPSVTPDRSPTRERSYSPDSFPERQVSYSPSVVTSSQSPVRQLSYTRTPSSDTPNCLN